MDDCVLLITHLVQLIADLLLYTISKAAGNVQSGRSRYPQALILEPAPLHFWSMIFAEYVRGRIHCSVIGLDRAHESRLDTEWFTKPLHT
jgi:hypothetical protein